MPQTYLCISDSTPNPASKTAKPLASSSDATDRRARNCRVCRRSSPECVSVLIQVRFV